MSATTDAVGAGVRAHSISFSYGGGTLCFDGLDVDVLLGSVCCVTGPSGVGKSTLLMSLCGVLPVTGLVTLAGHRLSDDANQRAGIRRRLCGLVFQRGELLPELTIVENVMLPLRLSGVAVRSARQTALELLDRFGLSECADRQITDVSGGQAQRASMARALVHNPAILFADEPTASLDEASAQVVLQELEGAAYRGKAVICASHDPRLVELASDVIEL